MAFGKCFLRQFPFDLLGEEYRVLKACFAIIFQIFEGLVHLALFSRVATKVRAIATAEKKFVQDTIRIRKNKIGG